MTPAFRDMRTATMLLAVLAASGAAWWLLLAGPSIAPMFICGVDGFGPADGAWNVERLLSLSGMWLVMTVAMAVPVGVLSSLRIFSSLAAPSSVLPDISPSRGEIESRRPLAPTSTFRAGKGARAQPISPPEGEMSGRTEGGARCESVFATTGSRPERYLFGYLAFFITISAATAITQWVLESAGIIGEGARIASPFLAGTALAAIGIWHIAQFIRRHPACGASAEMLGGAFSRGWRLGCSSFGCCLTMIGLQFVGGAMNAALMVGLALWMVVEAVLPWKRELTSLTGIALLTTGGLMIVSAFA